MRKMYTPGFNVYEQVDGAADALLAEAKWAEGLEVSEHSHDWKVGQHFDKPVPVRKPKPSLWKRIRHHLYVYAGGLGTYEAEETIKQNLDFLTRQAKETPFDGKYPFL